MLKNSTFIVVNIEMSHYVSTLYELTLHINYMLLSENEGELYRKHKQENVTLNSRSSFEVKVNEPYPCIHPSGRV